MGAQTETCAEEGDNEVTPDNTMVQYVSIREFDPGIVSKSGGFRKRPLIPKTRVVMADIQAFPEIYRLFQIHQFEWMTNAPGEYTGYLPREFYVVYATTLMNMAAETETTKRAQKTLAATFVPLDTIIIRGKTVNISEETINRMLHGPEYTTPTSVGLFEGKHYAVTSESEMDDPTS
ncbi:hypothetical protein KY290_027459 [Solanum tuberosum]|uniref:Uncharacterized protein n=1 Tax=Solanum tuberosum TaxID=4113 RepID=A0ABQ7UF64_SOLTU|nr:hypothetical protein KY290_027459 [Solanum tuberosum]